MLANKTGFSDAMIDTEKFAKELGRRIAEHRKQQDLSQARLAELVDCSQQMIGDYETGRRRIPACNLASIAEVLSVPVAQLLEGTEQPRIKPGPTSKLQKQIDQLQRLPKTQQKFVSQFLDTFLKQAS
ncbi:MAG: helix-turn-helix transcriptional regulator [Pontiellaceae bacterium]|nr:helix-turn-helix transcriptional regulator [Pontiellaceae bacterium]